MNELILHPHVRYGTYIISLAELWFTIRRELSHRYLHTARYHNEQQSMDHDVDIFLGHIVAQMHYQDYASDHIAELTAYLLEHSNYEFDQRTVHQLIDQALRVFLDTISIHVPSLVITPLINIKLKVVNRFDLILTVGPNERPQLRPN